MSDSPSRGCTAGNGLRATRVLVSTATERVVDDVHCNTTDAGPVGCGVLHLVVFVPCFHERFLDAATTGNDTDGCPAAVVEPLGLTAGHPDTHAVANLVNYDSLDTGRADKLAAIVRACLDIADVGTGRDIGECERVAVLDFPCCAPENGFANAKSLGDEHVDFCSVLKFYEGNGCIPCRIVFNIDDCTGELLRVITDVLQLGLVPVGWCTVCRASLASALCSYAMSHVPHLHNAKPAEDFFSGLVVLKAHNSLLLAVHVHERADTLDFLTE